MRVTVRQRLGEDYLHIATAGKAVVARHRLAPRGAGRTVRDAGHVIALERAVLAQVSETGPRARPRPTARCRPRRSLRPSGCGARPPAGVRPSGS
ncbi:hypothetical protein ACNPQM_43715 [Streptomyces sp. NPDC056231]|uniref:hypothetical protein n=1 Tax=Streptomyces sp. NPDC056231 TaxID=3345755 RepID=UPI003AAB0032